MTGGGCPTSMMQTLVSIVLYAPLRPTYSNEKGRDTQGGGAFGAGALPPGSPPGFRSQFPTYAHTFANNEEEI